MAVKFEHRVGVQAPAETIWGFVHDLTTWAEWNPLYPKAEGQIRIGSNLELTLALPGEAHRVIRPKVLDWVPNEQLHWRLTMLGGLVNNVRYIEIEALGPENCILSNGEIFGGLLGPMVAKQVARSVNKGFAQMGEALKARAEAAWREKAGAPTSA